MNIIVKKEYRKKGIGQILLEKLISLSKETKLNTIILEVNVNNKIAINLYKKNGFKEIRKKKKILL